MATECMRAVYILQWDYYIQASLQHPWEPWYAIITLYF